MVYFSSSDVNTFGLIRRLPRPTRDFKIVGELSLERVLMTGWKQLSSAMWLTLWSDIRILTDNDDHITIANSPQTISLWMDCSIVQFITNYKLTKLVRANLMEQSADRINAFTWSDSHRVHFIFALMIRALGIAVERPVPRRRMRAPKLLQIAPFSREITNASLREDKTKWCSLRFYRWLLWKDAAGISSSKFDLISKSSSVYEFCRNSRNFSIYVRVRFWARDTWIAINVELVK